MRLLMAPTFVFLTLAVAPSLALAAECDSPADDWILCEDFEQGALGMDAWYSQSPFVECLGCDNPGRVVLSQDPNQVFAGQWALHMPATASAGYRGASLTFRSCPDGQAHAGCGPLVGYERLYFRAWVKLAAEHRYVHHFMSLAGTRPGNYWDCDGNAGCRPNGQRAVGSTVDFKWSESRGEHELFFYTYYPEMHCDDVNAGGGYCGDMQPQLCDQCASKDMPCENEPECCWGNLFSANPRPILPRDRWVCLEMMVQLNTPGQADGQMAFWVDDQLGHQQNGMHWRDTADLQLNKVWVQHYIAAGDTQQSNAISWDNVVASTSRIGCGALPSDAGLGADVAATDGPMGDLAAGADTAVADAAGPDVVTPCTEICVDTRMLQVCDALGNAALQACENGELCLDNRCQAEGSDAGAGSSPVAEGCLCSGGHSSFETIMFWLVGAMLWSRRRRARGHGRANP